MSFLEELKVRSQVYQKITDACHDILVNEDIASDARAYLQGRVPKRFWKEYGFGYFPDDDNLKILYSLVDRDLLKDAGMLHPRIPFGLKGHFGDHNLMMPFKDVYGNIVALLGRSLLDKKDRDELGLHKYKYSKGAKKSLYVYGLDIAKKAIIKKDSVIGVEGQFDCIACHIRGIKNVVAFGGADLSPYQFFQLHRYTNNIVVIMDNDEAGAKARVRIRNNYGEYANVESGRPPEGYKDLEEFWREERDTNWCDAVTSQLKGI